MDDSEVETQGRWDSVKLQKAAAWEEGFEAGRDYESYGIEMPSNPYTGREAGE